MLYLWNDHILPKADVQLSPDDRGCYFGDGVYEVFRIYGGHLFEASAHMRRFEHSCTGIRLQLPYAAAAIGDRLEHLLHEESVTDGTLYLQVTRGAAERSHDFPEDAVPQLTAYCKPAARPLAQLRDGITAVTSEDIRWHRCDLKTLNLLPNVLAKQAASEQSAGEAILYRGRQVTECSASNVMIVLDGVIHTHPADQWILPGI